MSNGDSDKSKAMNIKRYFEQNLPDEYRVDYRTSAPKGYKFRVYDYDDNSFLAATVKFQPSLWEAEYVTIECKIRDYALIEKIKEKSGKEFYVTHNSVR